MRPGQLWKAVFIAALLLAGGCSSVVPGTPERHGGASVAVTSSDPGADPMSAGPMPVTSSSGPNVSSSGSVASPEGSVAPSAGQGGPADIAPQTVTWMTHTCSDLLSVDGIMATLPVADPADPVTYRRAWSVYYSGVATAAGLASDDMNSVAPPAIPGGDAVASGLLGYLGAMGSTAGQASQLIQASSLDAVQGAVAAESAAMAQVNPADYGLAALDQGQLKQLQSRIPACRQFLSLGGG